MFVDETHLEPVLWALGSLGIAVDPAEAARDAALEDIGGQRAWFLSAESVAVFKMLFFRPKDIVDLERLIAVRQDKLDTAYVREQLAAVVGIDDPRVVRWDRLCGRTRDANEPQFVVKRPLLLRGHQFFAVLETSEGASLEVELAPDMLDALREGDVVKLGERGLEVIARGTERS